MTRNPGYRFQPGDFCCFRWRRGVLEELLRGRVLFTFQVIGVAAVFLFVAFVLFREQPGTCFVRRIDYAKDWSDLSAFLAENQLSRLQRYRTASDDNDAYILVAERNERVIGVAVVHVAARDDMSWDPHKETPTFLVGKNAYLEYLEVSRKMQRKGVGTVLLCEVENEARRRGKEHLWAHTSDTNVPVHRLNERNGWIHHDTVYIARNQGRATRIYVKE